MKHPRNVPMTLLDIIKNGYFQQVRFLVDHGTDLDQKDSERRTPLMLCAFIEPEAWGVGLCRLLIENGATLFLRDKYGLNAFQYAVIYDRVDLVRVYLKAIDFNLNDADKLGNTALHYAVRSGNAMIVKLITQAHVKYHIPLDKANHDGFTPLHEAHRLSRQRCARILENTDALADVTHIEANTPLDLNEVNGKSVHDDVTSVRSSRKSLSRPRSSIISHRSSKSSLITDTEYSFRRSPTIISNDVSVTETGRRRGRQQPENIPPNEKNTKQLIRCASATDIRNNPEYLFQISPVDATFTPSETKRIRAKSAFVRRSEVESDSSSSVHRNSWRTEFKKLYVHYQFQCTPSYRHSVLSENAENASLPPLDKPITPATSEHGIDDFERGRRSRAKSAAISRQGTDENLIAGKGRQQSKTSSRKLSQNVGHGGKMGSVDGSLESSSESINSSVSSKRQADGKISKSPKEVTGRQSRTSSHKGVPAMNVEEVGRGGASEPTSVDPRLLRVINE
ncbi:protein shank-like [Dreissena polymorpha]|uniref:Uncharacterized protein n=1 Tax=Dreissena polymorpha TaxID=45954 RepID=A0A9D4CT18_DREPO|nr:protein shank-like [Dreissena polymorpha]XP_052244205.1 protein shank-like [Dreissena polymorpha]XP_052244206.1 protein shank-like [Dreissena polymorpha]KAH3731134.1 hypothetical protein DPMN_057140 [Dreissena polymorpha]